MERLAEELADFLGSVRDAVSSIFTNRWLQALLVGSGVAYLLNRFFGRTVKILLIALTVLWVAGQVSYVKVNHPDCQKTGSVLWMVPTWTCEKQEEENKNQAKRSITETELEDAFKEYYKEMYIEGYLEEEDLWGLCHGIDGARAAWKLEDCSNEDKDNPSPDYMMSGIAQWHAQRAWELLKVEAP